MDYEITSPTGKKYVVTAPEGASEQDVLGYAQSKFQELEQPKDIADTIPGSEQEAAAVAAAQPAAAPTKRWTDTLADFGHELGVSPITDPIIAGVDTAYSGLSNLFGKALGGTAGAVQTALNPTAPVENAADTSRGIEEFFTQPTGNLANASLGDVIGGASALYDKTGLPPLKPDTPLGQTLPGAVGEAITTLGPLKAGARPAAAAVEGLGDTLARPDVRGDFGPAVRDLRAAGFEMRPSDVQRINPGAEVPGLTREKFFGRDDTRRNMTVANRARGAEIAANEIGAPGARLDDATFEKVRQPELDTYKLAEDVAHSAPLSPELTQAWQQGIAAARFKPGAQPSITETIGALRRRATKAFQSDDLTINDQGYQLDSAADALEAAFGKQLESVGEPQMLDAYRASRERLAKIHDVESVTRGGVPDLHKLYARDQKFDGRMTGGLKMLATAGENLKGVTGEIPELNGVEWGHNPKGMIRHALGETFGRIPGLDVSREGFQAKNFGPQEAPDFISQYGRREQPFEIVPQQNDLGLGEALALEPPPGVAPERIVPSMPEHQPSLGLRRPLELFPPPGRTPEQLDIIGNDQLLDYTPQVAQDLGDVIVGNERLGKPKAAPKRKKG